MRHPRRRARPRADLPPFSSGHPPRPTPAVGLGLAGTATPPVRANDSALSSAASPNSVPATPTQAHDLPRAYRKS